MVQFHHSFTIILVTFEVPDKMLWWGDLLFLLTPLNQISFVIVPFSGNILSLCMLLTPQSVESSKGVRFMLP